MIRADNAALADVEAASAPHRVYCAILEGLYRGKYVAGQRLVEADLVREFQVGRGSIREGLNRLAAEGVVTLSFNRGAHIRLLTRAEAMDILAVGEALIALAARLAAGKIMVADNRKVLRESFDRLLAFKAGGDSFEFARARSAFYRTLVHVGGNRELARLVPGVQINLIRTQFRDYQSRDARLHDFQRIADAVLQGSAPKAASAVRRHFKSVLAAITQLPDDVFAPEH